MRVTEDLKGRVSKRYLSRINVSLGAWRVSFIYQGVKDIT